MNRVLAEAGKNTRDAVGRIESYPKLPAVLLVAGFFSAIALGISFCFVDFWFLPWISLGIFFILAGYSSPGRIFLLFYLAGFLTNGIALFWVSFVTKLGYVFLVAYLALYWGIFGVCIRGLQRLNGIKFIYIPALWVFLEYLEGIIFGGFGWNYLGYTQSENEALMQLSSLFGVKGISFLIVLANVVISDCIASKKTIRQFFAVFSFGVCLAAALLYGVYRLRDRQEPSRFLGVSVIQPNLPKTPFADGLPQTALFQVYHDLLQGAENDLVIFPEAAYPFASEVDELEVLKRFSDQYHKNILWGVILKEGGRYYNAAILFGPENTPSQLYKKMKLVPFGEYVPFRSIFNFLEVINAIGDMQPGKEYTVFKHLQGNFSVLICFEDVFSDFVRETLYSSVGFLINITDDSWFRGYPQSLQHLRIAMARAIEQDKFLVRSANSGISCIISNRGRVVQKIIRDTRDVFVPGVISFEVPLFYNKTVYNMIGDSWIFFLFLGSAFLGQRASRGF